MRESVKQVGRWLLWSPARFVTVTIAVAVFLTLWGVAGAALFTRGSSVQEPGSVESSGVECRRAVQAWTAAWTDKGTPRDVWQQRVQAVTTARGGQWVPLTNPDLIPPNGTVGEVTVDGDACVAVARLGDRDWTVIARTTADGWRVDSWDDGS